MLSKLALYTWTPPSHGVLLATDTGNDGLFFEKWRYNRITTDVEVIIQNEVLGS